MEKKPLRPTGRWGQRGWGVEVGFVAAGGEVPLPHPDPTNRTPLFHLKSSTLFTSSTTQLSQPPDQAPAPNSSAVALSVSYRFFSVQLLPSVSLACLSFSIISLYFLRSPVPSLPPGFLFCPKSVFGSPDPSSLMTPPPPPPHHLAISSCPCNAL